MNRITIHYFINIYSGPSKIIQILLRMAKMSYFEHRNCHLLKWELPERHSLEKHWGGKYNLPEGTSPYKEKPFSRGWQKLIENFNAKLSLKHNNIEDLAIPKGRSYNSYPFAFLFAVFLGMGSLVFLSWMFDKNCFCPVLGWHRPNFFDEFD